MYSDNGCRVGNQHCVNNRVVRWLLVLVTNMHIFFNACKKKAKSTCKKESSPS